MWIPKVANVADDHVEGTILDGALRVDGFGAQYSTRDLRNPVPIYLSNSSTTQET